MAQPSIDAVVSGTKGFAVALLAPLTERVGTRPRIAAEPGQVLGLCRGPDALAVVEFVGEGSLPAMQALVREGGGIRIVAGVPPEHAAAEGTLRALGIETVRWDGKVEAVLGAVERAIAAHAPPAAAAAPIKPALQPPAPAVQQAAPARPAASLSAQDPAPPQLQRTAAPRPPGAMASPAAARVPGPVTSGVTPAAPRPAAATPAGSGAAPSAQARPAAASSVRPAPAAAQAPRPPGPAMPAGARPPVPLSAPARAPASSPGVPSAAPRPAASAHAPAQAAPLVSSVPLTKCAASAPPPQPAAPMASLAAGNAPKPPPPSGAVALFEDVSLADDPVDVGLQDLAAASAEPADAKGPAPAAFSFHEAGVYAPPPSAGKVEWPAAVPGPAEAEAALVRAVAGTHDTAEPLQAMAGEVLAGLSDLERSVLLGEPHLLDVEPIRRAAVMRVRVAAALASAPAPGSPVDASALSALLGEIDGLLASVAAILEDASEKQKPSLEAIRNALVREAIDFSEASSRIAGTGFDGPDAQPSAARRVPTTRIIAVQDAAAGEIHATRGWSAWITLAVVIALGAAYHGWSYVSRPRFAPPPSMPGAPAGSVLSRSARGPLLVVSPTGRFDPAEVQRFRSEQELKGNEVKEVAPGVLQIMPAGGPSPASEKR